MTSTITGAIELPSPTRSRQSAAVDSLVTQLGTAPAEAESDAQAYQRERALRTAQALQQADRLGSALDAEDRDEMASLLGGRPPSRDRADAELEAFVLAAPPDQDEALLRYFLHRNQREYELHRPALREFEDQEMQPLPL